MTSESNEMLNANLGSARVRTEMNKYREKVTRVSRESSRVFRKMSEKYSRVCRSVSES